MIRKRSSPLRKIVLVSLVLIVAVGLGYVLVNKVKSSGAEAKTTHPEYLNFGGEYVFGVPKGYGVDEQSVPGVQLLYSGKIKATTMEEVYNLGGISVQAIADLTDHSRKAFKTYVNDSYLPELKKNLSTDEVQVEFDKLGGQDVARLTVKKDGKAVRFIYLKGGQHPAVVVAKEETGALKTIEQTLVDVEKSDINEDEKKSIKQSVQSTAVGVKDQAAKDIFAAAAPELREKNTEAELADVLKKASTFTSGDIVISGVVYSPTEFSASVSLTRLDKEDAEPGIGVLNYKKIDGQWKLNVLSLPSPE